MKQKKLFVLGKDDFIIVFELYLYLYFYIFIRLDNSIHIHILIRQNSHIWYLFYSYYIYNDIHI